MLAWVREELRLSLEQAHKALRRQQRESTQLAAGDIVDPGILRAAHQALHQAVGALELVGQSGAARVLAASEAAVLHFIASGPRLTAEAVATVERGSFAVLDFLAHVLAGKRVSPLALFPQYRLLLELACVERIHPADLWTEDYPWARLAPDPAVVPARVEPGTRTRLEALMLALMRQPDRQTLARMSDLCASLGAGAQGDDSTLWALAAAFFQAQGAGALRPDVYTKRVAPRLLALARSGEPVATVREQLARDLLFFCTQAQPARASRPVPRLQAAREAFGLGHAPFQDYESPRLGRFDPMWITQARRRLGAAREAWAAVAAGELHQLPALPEHFALVGDSLQRLLPGGAELAAELLASVRQPVDADGPPAAALAMEVATLLLVLESALEAGDLEPQDWVQRVPRLLERLRQAGSPGAAELTPEPWMAATYRAVSDQRSATAIARALRLALAELEKQLDQFVRQPAERDILEAAAPGVRVIGSVFAMLGLDDAAAAMQSLGVRVSRMALGDAPADGLSAQQGLAAMADDIGLLGLLVDVLDAQPQAARNLLRFDARSARLVRLQADGALPLPLPPARERALQRPAAGRESDTEPLSRDAPAEYALHETAVAQDALSGQASDLATPAGEKTVPQPQPEPSAGLLPPMLGALPDSPELPVLVDAITQPVPLDEPPAMPDWAAAQPGGDSLPVPLVEEVGLAGLEAFAGLEGIAAAAPPVVDTLKVVGPLTLEIREFNRFLNDADELIRELATQLSEWALDAQGVPLARVPEVARTLERRALALGQEPLAQVAGALAGALARCAAAQPTLFDEPSLFVAGAEHLQRLLHLFAAGFHEAADESVVRRLQAYEPLVLELAAPVIPPLPHEPPAEPQVEPEPEPEPEPEAEPEPQPQPQPQPELSDPPDPELFAIFAEEAAELLAELRQGLNACLREPGDSEAWATCMRALHTFKGGARLSGALPLGDHAHRLESRFEAVLRAGFVEGMAEALQSEVDALQSALDYLRAGHERPPPAGSAPPAPQATQALQASQPPAQPPPARPWADRMASEPVVVVPDVEAPEPALAQGAPALDEPRPARPETGETPAVGRTVVPMRTMLRVRAELMDRLFSQAGEAGTARSTVEAEVVRFKGSLVDLTDNLERLRRQLRDLEEQGEARAPRARPGDGDQIPQFDPLELDRYTRFQELVRMMAESLDDVATIQRSLSLAVQGAEDGLAAQAQAARGLMEDLLRTRLVEFDSIAERLHRVARQAARETGRQVRLDIEGASLELDRGVLDRMAGPFEHLVRNCVVHGIEAPEQRVAEGKSARGLVRLALEQAGNEVAITIEDDGRGLDYPAIRERALALGLLGPQEQPGEEALGQLVFSAGLSTSRGITELAGRGIGLDVVRAEVLAMGGRIELSSTSSRGTRVRLTLPLTTAITQAVLLRVGDTTVAVPSTIVEIVRRVSPADIERACDTGALADDAAGGGAAGTIPFYWLGALLDGPARPSVLGRAPRVVVLRSAAQRVAVFVDDILGHQEVVVKNLGPQLARLPGLAGMTVLPGGEVVPIYNPVALAALHGLQARERQRLSMAEGGEPALTSEPSGPLVLVVDDSLTVRKVTQRLLLREGYRVATAKDGREALERISEDKPAIVLSDLEMPRMDGFDLVRNLRADARTADLPVVIITSRIAQKHRDHAVALGVDHYLGKPFVERQLLELVARFAGFPGSR